MSYATLFPFFQTLLSAVGGLFVIVLVIVLHELGHFAVARWCGIKVQRFSIGFGKVLWKRIDKRGTEYTLCLLPLGGYVKMLGEGQEQTSLEDQPFAFNCKPLWARAAVVFAGPFVNFVLAIFLFWMVFQIGVTHVRPVIGEIIPHSIAAQAHLKVGDEVKQIGHARVQSWQTVLMVLMFHLGDKTSLDIVVQSPNTKHLQTHQLDLSQWQVDRDEPQLFQSIGFVPFQPAIPAIIAAVEPNSPAAGLKLFPGDQIVGINHHTFSDWVKLTQFLQQHPDQNIILGVKRVQHIHWFNVKTSHIELTHHKVIGYLGVQVKPAKWPSDMMWEQRYSLFSAFPRAVAQTMELTIFNGIVLVKMLSAQISLHTLGGPISVFQSADNAFKLGVVAYLSFLAFVSISLGFINLLPIPCLDGGYLLFFLIEGIFRRPISERYQIILVRSGFLLIILLMIQAIINDVLRF